MESVSPVFTQAEVPFELIITGNGPDSPLIPLVAVQIDLNVPDPDPEKEGALVLKQRFAMAVRFRLSEEERIAIIKGADIVITELVFGGPFTPINIQLCKPDQKPEIQL